MKECHYTVLGVTREEIDIDDEAVKRAYRKRALEWHPDKHSGKGPEALEVATERFKLIQEAHTVLSDANERHWYDAHRDEILRGGRGGGGGGGEACEERLVRLFEYFSDGVYSGFEDSPSGFYTVFRELFEKVVAEEALYAGEAAADSYGKPPGGFGTSTSPHAEVRAFYNFWGTYSSKMTFVWADAHNPNSAPSRQVRRAMEKENESARRAAKKERTEALRALVAFVKRRDKRWALAELEAKRAAETEAASRKLQAATLLAEKKAQREIARAAAAKAEEELAAEFAGAFRLADVEEEEEEEKGGGGGRRRRGGRRKTAGERGGEAFVVIRNTVTGEEEGEVSEFFCGVCDKLFKSKGAMENHERSKKHIEAMALAVEASGGITDDDDEEEEEQQEEEVDVDDEEEGEETEAEESAPASRVHDPDTTKKRGGNDAGEVEVAATRATKVMKQKDPPGHLKDYFAHSRGTRNPYDSDEDSPPPKRPVNKTELRRQAKAAARAAAAGAGEGGGDKDLKKIDPGAVLGGSRGRPLTAIAGGSLHAPMIAEMLEGAVGSHLCSVCSEVFSSRNALFQHIKITGHAVAVDVTKEKGGKTGRARRKGRTGGDSD